jgi:hypothetical protein
MATNDKGAGRPAVSRLDNTAFFDIGERDGYVRIDQSQGGRTLYTPEQARDLAVAILEAADETEGGGRLADDPEA